MGGNEENLLDELAEQFKIALAKMEETQPEPTAAADEPTEEDVRNLLAALGLDTSIFDDPAEKKTASDEWMYKGVSEVVPFTEDTEGTDTDVVSDPSTTTEEEHTTEGGERTDIYADRPDTDAEFYDASALVTLPTEEEVSDYFQTFVKEDEEDGESLTLLTTPSGMTLTITRSGGIGGIKITGLTEGEGTEITIGFSDEDFEYDVKKSSNSFVFSAETESLLIFIFFVGCMC